MQAIVAVDKNWGIGRENHLLFHIRKDLQFFKEQTEHKVVVMGRKTLQSLPKGQPLQNRVNIVLTTQKEELQGAIVARDHGNLFQILQEFDDNSVYIIGGAMVYRELLPYCSRVWVTKIYADGHATHFFDNLDKLSQWQITQTLPLQEENGYKFQVFQYQNNQIKKF